MVVGKVVLVVAVEVVVVVGSCANIEKSFLSRFGPDKVLSVLF